MEDSQQKAFTPALGHSRFTRLYDTAIALLTRERRWRRALARLVAPDDGDLILDVGCGTGSLAVALKAMNANSKVIALDPDPHALSIARQKASKANAIVEFREGFLDSGVVATIGPVTKVVSSLVVHQTPLAEKADILRMMREILAEGGQLYITDYGEQRSLLMRILFRLTVQIIDGVADTQPNADGCLPRLIEEAGFVDVHESAVVNTATGSIFTYTAHC